MTKIKIGIISIFIILIDQLTKYLANKYLILNESKIIIKKFFSLTLCYNKGVAWNFLTEKRLIIIIISIIALIFLVFFFKSFKKNTRNNIGFSLIIGGLFSNLIDRLFLGYVIDFLDFYIMSYDYPVFNIADISLVIGAILLIIAIFKGEDKYEINS